MPSDLVAARYHARAEEHARAGDACRRRADAIGRARLALFALLLGATVWGASGAPGHAFGAALAIAALVAFVVLVRAHRRARREQSQHERRRAVCELGVRRVRREWNELPAPAPIQVPLSHPYAADLDVTGRASLFSLLDCLSALPGRPTLLRWLLEPSATASALRERQEAARELAPRVELRDALHAHARAMGEVPEKALAHFVAWAESPPWLLPHRLLRAAAWVLPVLTVAAVVAGAYGAVPGTLWIVPGLVGTLLLLRHRRAIRDTLERASEAAGGFGAHAPMLALIESASFESPLLVRQRGRIAASAGGGASRALRRLEQLGRLADVRYSGMLYAAVNWFLVWDVHVIAALERWRQEAGTHVRDWLDALGELESLCALGMLVHDEPEWSAPELVEGDARCVLEGTALAHPLLPDTTRVANDVTVGPPGTLLLITGSNMSGKSTLLRAIGANAVLAQAGAVVCASRLRMPLLAPWTSIRVSDSLEEGVSLFMAELRRLKAIVDAARAGGTCSAGRDAPAASRDGAVAERVAQDDDAGPSSRPVLYLLDEILHGTNTAERQIAARTVLEHLLRTSAIGAVTTHDLSLAAGDFARSARLVHFTESVQRGAEGLAMTFDYRLRPGLATSVNALKLLEMVGL